MATEANIPNGKAPVHSAPGHSAHTRGPVVVQPARIDDLQPSYAQQIQHNADNPDAHSWYASLSKSWFYFFCLFTLRLMSPVYSFWLKYSPYIG